MKLSHRKLIQRLTADTAALAMREGRRVGQPGHEKAFPYLMQRLAELRLAPWKGDRFALTDCWCEARTTPERVSPLPLQL